MLRIFLFGLSNRRKQPERYAKCQPKIIVNYGMRLRRKFYEKALDVMKNIDNTVTIFDFWRIL
jgi:hypothetical protein